MIQIFATYEEEKASWKALQELSAICSEGWVLVGGFSIKALSQKYNIDFQRSTDDGDIVLNLRTFPKTVTKLESSLREIGMSPLFNPSGYDHRWVREDGAAIDILIPTGMGDKWTSNKFPGFGYHVETHGAQFIIDHSEYEDFQIEDARFQVRIPTLIGALYGKCSAFLNPDQNPGRHAEDIELLCSTLGIDELDELKRLRKNELDRIKNGLRKTIDLHPFSENASRVLRFLAS